MRFERRDDDGEKVGETLAGGRIATGKLGHLGETELRVWKRQATGGLGGSGQEDVKLLRKLDPHAATAQKGQLAVKRPEADPQLDEQAVARPRGFGQGGDQAMESRGPGQADPRRRPTFSRVPAAHRFPSFLYRFNSRRDFQIHPIKGARIRKESPLTIMTIFRNFSRSGIETVEREGWNVSLVRDDPRRVRKAGESGNMSVFDVFAGRFRWFRFRLLLALGVWTMSSRRPRTLQFAAETLEDRLLLSQTVTGMDAKGDVWVLKLEGPGALGVTKQPDANGNPQSLTSASDIQMITVAGGNPLTTRLIGRVAKLGAGSDGRVFFQNFQELGGPSEAKTSGGNGLYSVDMPNFWLGDTSPTGAPVTGSTDLARISIPDGLNTLRFGGADTTANFGAPARTSNTQFTINLGLPPYIGTSIIVNKIITSAQPATTTSLTAPSSPTQSSVVIAAVGRINLFQANEIDGNAALYQPSSRFLNQSLTGQTVGTSQGGTILLSIPNNAASVTGFIDNVRIGGNATNFSTQTNGHVSNFYVGGEANNVSLLGPGTTRNVYFGRGMDTTTINSHVIDHLEANRGAINSTVIVDRTIGRAIFGGDVVNTNVLTGYQQNLPSVFQNQTINTTALPPAQFGGGMTVLVAGNITNSVFAASTQPTQNVFGNGDLFIPMAHIKAKYVGTIDNSTATPNSPTKAFYAQSVEVQHGPIAPPHVPEPPFPAMALPRTVVGINGNDALIAPAIKAAGGTVSTPKTTSKTKSSTHKSTTSIKSTHSLKTSAVVPKGPATSIKKK